MAKTCWGNCPFPQASIRIDHGLGGGLAHHELTEQPFPACKVALAFSTSILAWPASSGVPDPGCCCEDISLLRSQKPPRWHLGQPGAPFCSRAFCCCSAACWRASAASPGNFCCPAQLLGPFTNTGHCRTGLAWVTCRSKFPSTKAAIKSVLSFGLTDAFSTFSANFTAMLYTWSPSASLMSEMAYTLRRPGTGQSHWPVLTPQYPHNEAPHKHHMQ